MLEHGRVISDVYKLVVKTYITGCVFGAIFVILLDELIKDFLGKDRYIALIENRHFTNWWPWALFIVLHSGYSILYIASMLRLAAKNEQRSDN